MPTRTRGISEVPMGLDKLSPGLTQLLSDLRETVLQLRGAQSPPRSPLTLTVTPGPGGNTVQWTTTDALYYTVYFNSTPSFQGAKPVFTGFSSQVFDTIGQAGVTRYYWVQGIKATGVTSPLVGPVPGTSGALNTGVAPPKAPPLGDQLVIDIRTGLSVPRGPIR